MNQTTNKPLDGGFGIFGILVNLHNAKNPDFMEYERAILKELEARFPEKFTDAEMDKASLKEFHIMYGYNKAIDDFRVLKGDDA